ncbi:hypothetical protein [Burkholderia stagnalis]|uniref:hypothetical protein n=1 Tax=Burkholderia stagnalis TaxID=1503054 RepID=UPI000F5BA913|nr:hypothetical protein [Burkholderia stagnalis]RQQ15808.1 hypothetical protein DF164_02815 [Burkholderia stagnalis]RQY74094.1 hypothetical protein DF110_02825 [Burkholderia stagnalis]
MRRFVKNKGGFLPREFFTAHDLCFAVHDILTQFLVSGEQSGVFKGRIQFTDMAEAAAFEEADDIFDWLETTGRLQDRAHVLKALVLPAVLSDMLHCIYEALESSRKGKLNVSYALIRKPLQESLFLLESIVLDEAGFAEKLATNPLMLRPHTAGGPDGHTRRIQRVLEIIEQSEVFDAAYLAQLRYEKVEDGFDGICNKAIHLFTEHKAIKTELLNINFIFSGYDAKVSQWNYLYSRLPYVLVYTWRVIEYVGQSLCLTHPEYDADMSRRVAAFTSLIAGQSAHITPQLQKFYDAHRSWILQHCNRMGVPNPLKRDVERMALTGALPGEDKTSVQARYDMFNAYAKLAHSQELAEDRD